MFLSKTVLEIDLIILLFINNMNSLQTCFSELSGSCNSEPRSFLQKQHKESTVCCFVYHKQTNPTVSPKSVHMWSERLRRGSSLDFIFVLLLSSSALGNQQLMIGQHSSEGRIKGRAHVGKCQKVPQAACNSIQEPVLFIPTKDSTSPRLWPSAPCDVLARRDEGEGWMSFWPLTTCLCSEHEDSGLIKQLWLLNSWVSLLITDGCRISAKHVGHPRKNTAEDRFTSHNPSAGRNLLRQRSEWPVSQSAPLKPCGRTAWLDRTVWRQESLCTSEGLN